VVKHVVCAFPQVRQFAQPTVRYQDREKIDGTEFDNNATKIATRYTTTLEDRSIVIPLRRRSADERIDALPFDRVFAETEPLRRKAVRWALDHTDRLGAITPAVPDTLHDRAQDLWRPLCTIAMQAGGDWPHRAQRAAVELAQMQPLQPPEHRLAIHLLHAVRALFHHSKADYLSSQTLVQAFANHPDPPWRSPAPRTPAQLARQLAPFGIRPTIVHRTRTQVRRGYRRQDFHHAFTCYLPAFGSAPKPEPQ
jgi:hypothetical protein